MLGKVTYHEGVLILIEPANKRGGSYIESWGPFNPAHNL
jgi:ribosomal protein S16